MEKKDTAIKMNLCQKLVEVQKSARGLGKDARAQSYEYVSGSKVLSVIRPKMDELGLLLVQEVNEITNERVDYQVSKGARSEMHSRVMMTFKWIDADTGEVLAVPFGANGCNGWDKGLGSALTYAERYFLLKFFHIPTDEDDIDARNDEEAHPVKKIAHDDIYWKFVESAGTNKTNKAGQSARECFAKKYHPTEVELQEFDNFVLDYKVANGLR